jgi:regulator of replication initiation timing
MKQPSPKPTKKEVQKQIGELGNGLGIIYKEVEKINSHLVGLESLTFLLAEFLKKKDKFETFLKKKIKEENEKTKKPATDE